MPVTLEGVRFRYAAKDPEVLSGVDLSIPDGQLVALVGPSGSGKTTLLQLVGGILRPTGGRVENTVPLADMRWVFQTPTLLARQSVRQNIDVAVVSCPWGERERRMRVDEVIRDVRLEGFADAPVNRLSGGQQQRVQIARALASRPPLVLADEPTGQLDHHTTGVVLDAVRAARDRGTTVVVVTHDPYVAERCERVVALEDGVVKSDRPARGNGTDDPAPGPTAGGNGGEEAEHAA
ncbi:ABC transporter ATP-binding protein [Bifidobacterium avesanii]|uniref:ATP-binding cassette domain-containing protein n=1 Tax=Bifidobacterium avesanii TaxID=1798157 RepID=A0A7K3TFX4_9BIFI|nr:ATP-binding cassette domain-containing protein [Bifidobacterium avesanii]KAB8295570.1 macrolide ABC transporter ATP-binding protein [Bifidobacterium avesanii]NEG77574.1 ATP-binding cassette domain-containing protein [Bifidobacterium avesanii]